MKTLALNTIVGKGESELLDRMLKSLDAKNTFDEIVIVMTHKDELVYNVAKKYTNKIIEHEWDSVRYPHGNFSNARNKAIDNTISDYIWWLDTDDIIECKDIAATIEKIKKCINAYDIDFFIMPYKINYVDGIFQSQFQKERIFKRQKNVRWIKPVHEQLTIDASHKKAELTGISILHLPIEGSNTESVERNISIMDNELSNGIDDRHLKLFYAKELLVLGKIKEDINIVKSSINRMESIVDGRMESKENLAALCNDISFYYCDEKNTIKAEIYAMLSLSFSENFAEPYIVLGDICISKNNIDDAIINYRLAMSKKTNSSQSVQNSIFYSEVPCNRLSRIYASFGNYEQALLYNRKVKKEKEFRKYLLKKFIEKESEEFEELKKCLM